MNDRVLVAHVVAYIEAHLEEPVTTDSMVAHSGYSLNRLRQKFFSVTGDTPSGYLRKRRLTESAKDILKGERIVDVGLKYGYSSQENFTTAFRSYFGVTPSEIAKIEGKYRRFIRRLREAYTIMELANLAQPPLNTTLMGCMKGASDYFDGDLSVPMLFGLSGHAFLINIHKDLHPSSPYVWKKESFRSLLSGIGIDTVAEYDVRRDGPESTRRGVEQQVKTHLNDGRLCVLDFLEHQLISGYDENGFMVLRPWGGMAPSEVPQVSFGSWDPCLKTEGWAHLTVVARAPRQKTVEQAARDALGFALKLHRDPSSMQVEGYRIGQGVYENWIAGVERGLGTTHGHVWNGMVWSECRKQASEFFRELAEVTDAPAAQQACGTLQTTYGEIADALTAARDKDLAKAEQLSLLKQARDAEAGAAATIEDLVAALS
jgi:AraC-like DNA-binding protein